MALPGLQQGSYDALYQGLVDALLNSQLLASTGAWLHLPQHSVQLSSAEQTLAEKLLPAIAAGRYDPPWVRDLARDHAAGEELVRQLLKKLSRQGQLFQVVKDLFYAPARMDELAALVADIASQHARGGGSQRLPRRHRSGPQARHPDSRILRPHRLHAPRARRPSAAP
jgi:selenocysteine-specific elongation factor